MKGRPHAKEEKDAKGAGRMPAVPGGEDRSDRTDLSDFLRGIKNYGYCN